jgi:hypothetical protein
MNQITHTVNFYIDDFNFYHRISDYQKQTGICLKWLNYYSLCKSFLQNNQVMGKVNKWGRTYGFDNTVM